MKQVLQFQFEPPFHTALEIRESPGKGRGVFATQFIPEGAVIENAPVIAFNAEQWAFIEQSLLYHYVFEWGTNGTGGALALGYGSLYNHDYQPNAYYVRQETEGYLRFIAYRDIQPGEEITVNYNGAPTCQDPVWFQN